VRLEGLGQLKNPMTSPVFQPATFRLVAQYLKKLRNRVAPGLYNNTQQDANNKDSIH
jgi:hypothetical protein